jgi:hypothetical protein
MYFIADGGVNRLNYLTIVFKIIFFLPKYLGGFDAFRR